MILSVPTTEDMRAALEKFGVSTIAELKKLPLDEFIQHTVHHINASVPQSERTALEGARIKVVSSQAAGDGYAVAIEMTLNGKISTGVYLAKLEGHTWKFCGATRTSPK